uniref:Cyclin-F n=1 Tax=Branchiostoma floridae TaxID=7739 RepID=C3Z7N7_BRAFL|eukprot:XP_002595380.1 hypothetical protein BRAFLDRAFT_119004 [Branchiostoma floridae]
MKVENQMTRRRTCRRCKSVYKQCKPSVRKAPDIWALPEELQLLMLRYLPAKDLANMRLVHSSFKQLVDNNPTLWVNTNFGGIWPSPANVEQLKKIAEYGNLELLIKLGVAYLYNEGFPEIEGEQASRNGVRAAEFFMKSEELVRAAGTPPFTWLFIRPPWTTTGTCCKSLAFKTIKDQAASSENTSPALPFCIAKAQGLFDDEEERSEAIKWFEKSANMGSEYATFTMWELKHKDQMIEPVGSRHAVRLLREITASGSWQAQLELCNGYAKGLYGGVCAAQAAEVVRQFVLSSQPSYSHRIFEIQKGMNNIMRFILVDWLVEVASMKDFSTQVLHAAVRCVDRYLMTHKTPRSKLQLVGVASMVLVTRYLAKDILTVREAVWLTDNTYKYEDVVRMMGELTATLRGEIRALTSADYLDLFFKLQLLDQRTKCLAAYICDLALLQTEIMGTYSPAVIAASALLLAKMTTNKDAELWSSHMTQFTGLQVVDLLTCTLQVYHKCLCQPPPRDHHNNPLTAVRQHYGDERFCKVSEIELLSNNELIARLGLDSNVAAEPITADFASQKLNIDILGSSPRPVKSARPCPGQDADRSTMVTPIMELSMDNSGYEGDMESEGEYLDMSDEEMSEDDQGEDEVCTCCSASASSDNASDWLDVISPTATSKPLFRTQIAVDQSMTSMDVSMETPSQFLQDFNSFDIEGASNSSGVYHDEMGEATAKVFQPLSKGMRNITIRARRRASSPESSSPCSSACSSPRAPLRALQNISQDVANAVLPQKKSVKRKECA